MKSTKPVSQFRIKLTTQNVPEYWIPSYEESKRYLVLQYIPCEEGATLLKATEQVKMIQTAKAMSEADVG